MPAKLWVDPAASKPVVLAAALPGQAAAAAPRNLYIANKGNTSLTIALSLEPRSDSILEPGLWLDPSSNYSAALPEQSTAAYDFDGSGGAGNGALRVGAGERRPARLARSLQAPLRLRGQLQRYRPCTDQFLVLSTTPTLSTEPGGEQLKFLHHSAVLPVHSCCIVFVFEVLSGAEAPGTFCDQSPCVESY